MLGMTVVNTYVVKFELILLLSAADPKREAIESKNRVFRTINCEITIE